MQENENIICTLQHCISLLWWRKTTWPVHNQTLLTVHHHCPFSVSERVKLCLCNHSSTLPVLSCSILQGCLRLYVKCSITLMIDKVLYFILRSPPSIWGAKESVLLLLFEFQTLVITLSVTHLRTFFFANESIFFGLFL